jgi:hypothetical protein
MGIQPLPARIRTGLSLLSASCRIAVRYLILWLIGVNLPPLTVPMQSERGRVRMFPQTKKGWQLPSLPVATC